MAIKKVTYMAIVSDEELAARILETLRGSNCWWRWYTKYFDGEPKEPVSVTMEEGRRR